MKTDTTYQAVVPASQIPGRRRQMWAAAQRGPVLITYHGLGELVILTRDQFEAILQLVKDSQSEVEV